MNEEAKTVGRLFERARNKHGGTHHDAWLGVYDRLGPYTPTEETIRQYHHGAVVKPDLVVLLALADYYGLTLKKLPPAYADVGGRLSDVLVRISKWNLEEAGQDHLKIPA